jgi:hypothetical protein
MKDQFCGRNDVDVAAVASLLLAIRYMIAILGLKLIHQFFSLHFTFSFPILLFLFIERRLRP